jgi:hypothetical protein
MATGGSKNNKRVNEFLVSRGMSINQLKDWVRTTRTHPFKLHHYFNESIFL